MERSAGSLSSHSIASQASAHSTVSATSVASADRVGAAREGHGQAVAEAGQQGVMIHREESAAPSLTSESNRNLNVWDVSLVQFLTGQMDEDDSMHMPRIVMAQHVLREPTNGEGPARVRFITTVIDASDASAVEIVRYNEALQNRADTVSAAIDFWYRQAQNPQGVAQEEQEEQGEQQNVAPVESPLVHIERADQLGQFLERLQNTAEFRSEFARPALAMRVVNMLQSMLMNERFRERAMECIDQALESCDDRVIVMLNQVELLLQIQEAEESDNPEYALQALAAGLIKLNKVHQCAAEFCQGRTNVDEVEVFLAYETQLADWLELPITTRNMIFSSMAGVTETDIQYAVAEANAEIARPGALEEFLEAWDPWQRFLRREAAGEFIWDQLEVMEEAPDEDAFCPITREPYEFLEQPVGVEGSAIAMEMQPFIQWWVDHGNNPANQQPVKRDQIKRFELPRGGL